MNPADPELPTLRALNRRVVHNFVTRDVPSHVRLRHPRFHAISPLGRHVEPADCLACWDRRDECIDRFGSMALVSATNRWVRLQDGVRLVGMTFCTDSPVRDDGRWLGVQAQLRPMADARAASDDGIVVRDHAGVLDTSVPGTRP